VVELQRERNRRREALPIEIPRISASRWEKPGSKKRERAVTGDDLAEQEERGEPRQRR